MPDAQQTRGQLADVAQDPEIGAAGIGEEQQHQPDFRQREERAGMHPASCGLHDEKHPEAGQREDNRRRDNGLLKPGRNKTVGEEQTDENGKQHDGRPASYSNSQARAAIGFLRREEHHRRGPQPGAGEGLHLGLPVARADDGDFRDLVAVGKHEVEVVPVLALLPAAEVFQQHQNTRTFAGVDAPRDFLFNIRHARRVGERR